MTATMKIGIYNQPDDAALGGTEYCVAVLAEALRRRHEVEIIHQKLSLTIGNLEHFFGVNLTGVRLRKALLSGEPFSQSWNPWLRYWEKRRRRAAISEPYDLFVIFTHAVPPPCHARSGVLVVLFPFSGLHRVRRNRRRLDSYQVRLSISEFTREWTRRWWLTDSEVWYPPVNVAFAERPKKKRILSVGRFVSSKAQRKMMEAFRAMSGEMPTEWEYWSVGFSGQAPPEQVYLQNVQELAATTRATVAVNLPAEELRRLYEESSIFWHAAGCGCDEQTEPFLMEHFGISTVEAMAAGCVPVLVNKGGQKEIVTHGVNGFLWNDLEELRGYSLRLVRNPELFARMSAAARRRAQDFSSSVYSTRFEEIVRPHCPRL